MELSSPDIKILVDELQYLIGGKIQKIYHEKRDMHINIYVTGHGTKTLVFGPGKFFVTSYSLKHRDTPTSFCMFMRKRLKSSRIVSLEQHGFERIIVLRTDLYNIVFEIFSTGNIIVTDKEDKIISLLETHRWKDRTLRRNETYVAPPSVVNAKDLTEPVLYSLLGKTDKKIVPFLAREISFGGKYAEEIAGIGKIDKDRLSKDLSKAEVKLLFKSIVRFLNPKKITPYFVVEDGKKVDLSYLKLERHKDSEKVKTKTFDEAVDECFIAGMELELEKSESSVDKKRISSLEKRLDIQRGSMKHLEQLIEENRKKGDMIYENFQKLDDLRKLIEISAQSSSWSKAKAIAESNMKDRTVILESLDVKDKIAKVSVDGYKINILIEETLSKSAEIYYKKSKTQKAKLPGLKLAIENTLKSIDRKDSEKKTRQVITKKESIEKKWYEKFRNFESSEGFLCIGGKDATSNEIVVKKHTEKGDIVFHADIPGSPFMVIKAQGKGVGDATIEEAAQFTAVHSKAWKANAGVIDVYWVKPEQVTKEAPSGEYVQKGAFMIYGKKNVMRAELKIAVCMIDGIIVSGPVSAIKKKTNKFIIVHPGYTRAKDLAKLMKTEMFRKLNKSEQDILRKMTIDKFQACIPSDKGDLER